MREDQLRAAMVAGLLAGGRIRTPAVRRAFHAVPRHLFLPGVPSEQAYQDEAVATKWLDGVAISSASQPSMMAIMLEQLELRPGHRVLEVGAGTGYNAALMARLVGPTGSVSAVDIDEDLVTGAAGHLAAAGVEGITLATRDGALGYPERAPYDRIVLTVGSGDIQPAWWRQLAPGGRLLLPLSVRGSQVSVALDLVDGPPHLHSTSARGCGFVRMRGQGAVPDDSRPFGVDGLAVQGADDRVLDPAGLRAVFAQPGVQRPSPVRLAAIDLWDGLGLWLAVREPAAGRLLVSASAAADRSLSLLPSGMDGGTVALLGERGVAVVVPREREGVELDVRFPVAVRPYGPDGDRMADRLAEHLVVWAAAGRPSAAGLRLRAYPVHPSAGPAPGAASDGAAPAGAAVVCKEHSRLVLDWPGNQVPPGPILGR